ncbi:SAP domain protein, putative [Talaromyces stipitatus ATCC 10500]|uniref:SAP domain protein, putative n=1 Tax=Talaromyces stipitatus (strain ATCC 10500 / CBS 375.48 / QM 6759 / NRRL 1006) TaxID=441959 RepID=B8MFJ5_TALSN|nr:SAP domain protein, putative [Talaromyces stipitatus ATCC 10500]EED16985.1 SAP domain protein, putative [Talaromyces stipitatus ATCC 10500]
MASEYEKKTVAQLQEILKSRGLTANGKKAELIARLQEADKSSSETKPTETKPDATAEDIIDWDDEAPATEAPLKESTEASTEAGAATIAAGGQGQTLGEDPAKTSDLHVESAPQEQPAAEEKPAVDYSIGLQPTEVEEELRKRKARAEKFGIVAETGSETTEAEKILERAKRFGTGASNDSDVGINRLDQALPNERARKRGRGDDQGGRGGKRRNNGGRNRHQNNNRKGNNPTGRSNAPKPVFSEKDRAAAEARKNRFATAA